MLNNVAEKVETTRTMLTTKQLKDTFLDAEGKRIFSDYMIQTLTREGLIPFVRLHNRKLLFCKESVESWLSGQETKNTVKSIEANGFGLRKL